MRIYILIKRFFMFLFLLSFVLIGVACTSSNPTIPMTNISVFGEPGLIPEIFAPDFINTEDNYEFAGTFSPDYNYYFFTRRVPGSTNRIFYTEFVDGEWLEPKLSPISEDVDEFEPYITPDGKTLYFGSKRNNHNEYVFYQSEFVNGAWQTPVYSENGLNSGFSMYVSVANSGNIYFTVWNYIYVIQYINGEFQPRISTGIMGTHPYISPDESYILIDRESGSSSYIYISINQHGHWSTPVKLGEEINQTDAQQLCSSVTTDGKYFFFTRFMYESSDIYWVDASYLDQYLN